MMKTSDLAQVLGVVLTIVTHRLHTLLALLMVFGLFCWAMVVGAWIHFAIAAAFGIVIFLPVLLYDKTSGVPHEEN